MQTDTTRGCGCCGAKPGKPCADDCATNELKAYVFERPDGYRFVMGFGGRSNVSKELTIVKAKADQGEHVRLVATVTMKVPQLPVFEVAAETGDHVWVEVPRD